MPWRGLFLEDLDFSDVYDMDRTALVGKSNIKLYLRYKALKANWKEPKIFPENSILKSLHVETKEKAKKGEVYITGHGWLQAKLNDGNFNLELNAKVVGHSSAEVIREIKQYYERLWHNKEGHYTVDYPFYENKSLMKTFLYRLYESTGISTF